MHTLRAYLELAQAPQTRHPLAASLLGRIPESIVAVSLILEVRQTTGSYAAAGIAAAAFALGSALAAPVAGRGLDRLSERKLLVGLAIGFGAALVAIVITSGVVPVVATVALAAAAGLARPPLDAAVRALWPRVLPPDRLQAAYSLDATLQELIWIVGPLMLSALLLLAGPSLPLLACAALSVSGTLAFAASPSLQARPLARGEHAPASLHSLGLTSLLTAGTLYGVAVGLLTVSLTAFSTEHHARSAVGVLVAIWGIGSIVGGAAYGTTRWKTAPERRALLLLGLLAMLLVLLAAAHDLVILALLMLGLGLPLSPWLGTLNEAGQTLAPAGRAAEVFTWIFALITIGTALGNATGGPIVQHAGTQNGFLLAGAAAAIGAALGGAGLLIRHGRADAER
jgi:MFS family permease